MLINQLYNNKISSSGTPLHIAQKSQLIIQRLFCITRKQKLANHLAEKTLV